VKKIIATIGVVLAPISFAHADGGVFPTDVLPRGKWDISASASTDSNSYDVRFAGIPGKRTFDMTSESLQLRYGLGSDFHVGAQLNHASRWVTRTDFAAPSAHFVNRSGEGSRNPGFWLKYGLLNDAAKPFSLSGEIQISPNTSGKQSSSVLGLLSAGWQAHEKVRLYGTLSSRAYDDSVDADTHSINVKAYLQFSDRVTFIPQIGHVRAHSTSVMTSYSQNYVGLALQARLLRDTYLIPGVTLYRNTSAHSKDGMFYADGAHDGRAVHLTLLQAF